MFALGCFSRNTHTHRHPMAKEEGRGGSFTTARLLDVTNCKHDCLAIQLQKISQIDYLKYK